MPSPVGHALGGFAVGWLAAESSRLIAPASGGGHLRRAGRRCRTSTCWSKGRTGSTRTRSPRWPSSRLLAAVSLRAAGPRVAAAGSATGPGVRGRGGVRVARAARLARRRPQRPDRHPRALAVHRRLLPVRRALVPARSSAATGCPDSGPRTCARSAGSCWCSRRWSRGRACAVSRAIATGARRVRRSCRSRDRTSVRDARRRRAGGAGDRRDTSGRRARRAARRGSRGRRRGR